VTLLRIAELDSYTERSPSGRGLRLFAFGGLPPGQRKLGDLEVYDDARFLTVTGHQLAGTPATVERRYFELRDLHARAFGSRRGDATPAGNAADSFDADAPVRLDAWGLAASRLERPLPASVTGFIAPLLTGWRLGAPASFHQPAQEPQQPLPVGRRRRLPAARRRWDGRRGGLDGTIGRRMTRCLLRSPAAAPGVVAGLPRPGAAAQQSPGWEPSRDSLSVASREQSARVVERTFSWILACRRLVRDYEQLAESRLYLHHLATIAL
jgi:hypothetical protein